MRKPWFQLVTLLAAVLSLPAQKSASPPAVVRTGKPQSAAAKTRPGTPFPIGSHRMAIECPGGQLPFFLTLNGDSPGSSIATAATIFNGDERIAVPSVTAKADGRLWLRFPHYDAELALTVDAVAKTIAGEWIKRRGSGKATRMQVQSTAGKRRFPQLSPAPKAAAMQRTIAWCSGRFRVQFGDSKDVAVGIFAPATAAGAWAQRSSHRGTFLTTLGDYRYLAGQAGPREMRLSCFDGAHAFLFQARPGAKPDTIEGDFWSSDSWHEAWTATRDPDAVLADGFSLTRMRDDAAVETTPFLDLDGQQRTLADAGLAGTVRILEVFGTWCPNCQDHGAYMAELHRRYADRGVKIIGLAFEHAGDAEHSIRQVQTFVARHGVEYPVWLGGSSNKQEATKQLGFFDRVRSFPTTVFLDHRGQVRGVYQGWSGPATGASHVRLKRRFEERIDALLAERSETVRSGRVLDHDGQPVVNAEILCFAANDIRTLEVLTDTDGRFRFPSDLGVQSVAARYQAVLSKKRPLAADNAITQLRLPKPKWRISGRVLLPNGRPAEGVDVALTDAVKEGVKRTKVLASTTIDAQGRFAIRCGEQAPARLLVDPLGLRHAIEGPFEADAHLNLDMRLLQDQFQRIVGRVLDLDGAPAAGAPVVAFDETSTDRIRCGAARTAADGKFELWTSRRPNTMVASVNGIRLHQQAGEWDRDEPIEFDPKVDALVSIRGRVENRDNSAAPAMQIYTSTDGKLAPGSRALTRSGRDGDFRAMIRRGTKFLIAADGREVFAVLAAPNDQEKIVLQPSADKR
ncbi:MAG: redoxin domain-containing protein [Planctomycetota bacterium]